MPDKTPFLTIDGDYSRGLVLICDHARNAMPESYGSLGLPVSELERHIAYDIGAEGLTRGLAERLGVPAVMSTFSRLLIDPNRGEDDPTLIRQLSDGAVIPANYPLSAAERDYRLATFFRPYDQAIGEMIARSVVTDNGSERTPVVLSVHTMTDKWNNLPRPWHASVLWDNDPRFAKPLMAALHGIDGCVVGDNEPYDGALIGDTLYRHCTEAGIAHALIEIRQDLVREQSGIDEWVEKLVHAVEQSMQAPDLHERRHFGSRTLLPMPRHSHSMSGSGQV